MNLRLWIDLVSYSITAKGFGVMGAPVDPWLAWLAVTGLTAKASIL